ncbi:MAG: AlpA family phage regulatory protein [Burkholderiales bacterium]
MAPLGDLPAEGFIRLNTVLRVIPVSRSTWWQGVKDGRFPAAVKLGPRTTAWRVEDIRALIDRAGSATSDRVR